jgi:hypothetical protein
MSGDMKRGIKPLCDALRRNDPSIVCVNTGCRHLDRNPTCPAGWGAPLGAALLQNTVVEEIALNPVRFFSSNVYIPSEAKFMLCYIRSSAHLHTVTLGHIHDGIRGEDQTWPRELNGKILRAMADNLNTTTLNANASLPEDDFEHFLVSSSIKNMCLGKLTLKAWNLFSLESRNRVVKALGSTVNLQNMRIGTGVGKCEVLSHIVNQLVSHTSMQDLHIRHRDNGYMMSMHNLLRTTMCLQRLVIEGVILNREVSESLIAGLRPNQTVTELSLCYCECTEDATRRLIVFFQTIANKGNNILRHLGMRGNRFHGRACSHFDSEVLPALLIQSSLESVKLIAHGEDVSRALTEFIRLRSQIRLRKLHVKELCLFLTN